MADVPAPIPADPFTHHADDGLATVCRAVDDFAVFYYRGDSQGEGGNGQSWLGAVLFQTVIFSLPKDGLVVTDGSNSTLCGSPHSGQQLRWAALAGGRHGQLRRIGDRIRWSHVVLECVHESLPACRASVWHLRVEGALRGRAAWASRRGGGRAVYWAIRCGRLSAVAVLNLLTAPRSRGMVGILGSATISSSGRRGMIIFKGFADWRLGCWLLRMFWHRKGLTM